MIPHIAFYLSLSFVLYVYLGYPVLLWLWRELGRRSPVKPTTEVKTNSVVLSLQKKWEPAVTIIVAAYNEESSIERKILNLLTLDYPASKTQIILSLDGPTDNTESIARKYESGRIRVLLSKLHAGKAEALNRAVAKATGKILIFADARQLLDRTAVRELVSNFTDSTIGAVSGELLILDESGTEAGDAVGLYWRYEKRLRSMESDIHSTMGATGALYAIRRDLYIPIPRHTILDDVAIPMNSVLKGKRVVFDRDAKVYDRATITPAAEFTRKVRTLSGNFQLLKQMPELMAPWRNPVAIQFLSHKVGRLLVPYFLLALFTSNLFLRGPAYRAVLALQCISYFTGCVGLVIARWPRFEPVAANGRMKSLILFPYTFILMNWAAVLGLYQFLSKQHNVWGGYESATSLPRVALLHDLTNSDDSVFSDAA